jgi:prefoldin subunit 5
LYDRADQSSELRQQIAALQAEITALRKIVSEADIQRKLQNAVARAGREFKTCI